MRACYPVRRSWFHYTTQLNLDIGTHCITWACSQLPKDKGWTSPAFMWTAVLMVIPCALLSRTMSPLVTGPLDSGTRLLLSPKCGSCSFFLAPQSLGLLLIGLNSYVGNSSHCLQDPTGCVVMAVSSQYSIHTHTNHQCCNSVMQLNHVFLGWQHRGLIIFLPVHCRMGKIKSWMRPARSSTDASIDIMMILSFSLCLKHIISLQVKWTLSPWAA